VDTDASCTAASLRLLSARVAVILHPDPLSSSRVPLSIKVNYSSLAAGLEDHLDVNAAWKGRGTRDFMRVCTTAMLCRRDLSSASHHHPPWSAHRRSGDTIFPLR
jgi:hypothetical protein